MKIIFLDIDGVLTHTDYLNWQTRHIDPEKRMITMLYLSTFWQNMI